MINASVRQETSHCVFRGFGPEIMVLAKGSMLAWRTQKSLKAFQVRKIHLPGLNDVPA